jgi:hypothetical protein
MQAHQAQPETIQKRKGPEPQQICGRHKIPDAAVGKEAHLRSNPLEVLTQAELMDELDHRGIGGKQVVVEALQAGALDLNGAELAADFWPPLKQQDLMAHPQQLVGRG